MAARIFVGFIVGAVITAGCGSAPTQPTSSTSQSSGNAAGAEAAIAFVMSQAFAQPLTPIFSENGVLVITTPCPNGGDIKRTIKYAPPPLRRDEPLTLSSTSEVQHRDCNYGGVIVNGDPSVILSSEYSSTALLDRTAGASLTSTSVTRTTGGMRHDMHGVLGRAVFDCTLTSTITYPPTLGDAPQISFVSTGTITTESPLGNRVVRSCGP